MDETQTAALPAWIYLAGGCFWGLEAYVRTIPGVISTRVGYANGTTSNPTYGEVCTGLTGHAETVEVTYDSWRLSLADLLYLFFDVIDPTRTDGQGPDIGNQYRSGIYYTDQRDRAVVEASLAKVQEHYSLPVRTEATALRCFFVAEESHQSYLEKNPDGYCHIPRTTIANVPKKLALLPQIRGLLPLQYEVTQHEATEPPFDNEFDDFFEPGIYVDVLTGQPLFASSDKYQSGCGWPAFTRPVSDTVIETRPDHKMSRPRVEVRSAWSDSHLGHVFADGPEDRGGLRYCINSAALKFVPLAEMADQGYAQYVPLVA